ncbi:methyltransferase domain-containing protein [Thiocapsa rosea]|uniref:Methyltransferase family protein n=1 Tax=Thiocapsa rosea TaxID=69360 RepID=A0A495V7L7_9GAMM|nr:methyltransferase domain-containing protein [Thiocapsa rosea]RKT44710.1 methyltransferase family protein [Thiocapsa rosea]
MPGGSPPAGHPPYRRPTRARRTPPRRTPHTAFALLGLLALLHLPTLRHRGDQCGKTASIPRETIRESAGEIKRATTYAQRQFPGDQCPNLSFEVADARHLGFEARFDLVVSFNALHWVPQAADALRGIRRALKPEGLARLRLVTRAALTSLEEVAEEVRREPHWSGAFAGFKDPYLRLSAEEYAALAESLGLKRVSLSSESKRWDFQTEEAFFGFCNAGFGAWTHRLPEARRRAFVEESMRRYRAVIDGAFGERFVFHFMQTDVVLALTGGETSVD